AFTLLEHKNDFKAAAKALIERGFGTHKRWVEEDGEWKLRIFQNPCPKHERIAKPGEGPPIRRKHGKNVPASPGANGPPRLAGEPGLSVGTAAGGAPHAADPHEWIKQGAIANLGDVRRAIGNLKYAWQQWIPAGSITTLAADAG